MTATIKTWGECTKYTWDNHWKHTKSAETVWPRVNRLTDLWGKSFPLKKLSKGYEWINAMNDIRQEDEVSNATVNRAISVGTHALKFTYSAGLHLVKCPRFERLDEQKNEQPYLSKQQVEKLVFYARDHFDRDDLADAIIGAAYSGVRQSELLRVRPTDIDIENGVLHVRQSKTKTSTRAVPLHPKVKAVIEKRMGNNLIWGDDWNNKDALYRPYKRLVNYCGFDNNICWHSLRHSFATWLAAVDHPRTIMAILGHSNIQTTLRYCKVTDEAVHTAVSKI